MFFAGCARIDPLAACGLMLVPQRSTHVPQSASLRLSQVSVPRSRPSPQVGLVQSLLQVAVSTGAIPPPGSHCSLNCLCTSPSPQNLPLGIGEFETKPLQVALQTVDA